MLNYKEIFLFDPFSKSEKKKKLWYLKNQIKLSKYHYNNCYEYKKISGQIFKKVDKIKNISELPFIHSNIFKQYNLKSTGSKELSKTLTSSGTRGSLSIINLDRKTSLLQSKALIKIFSNIFSKKVPEIFFIETPDIIKNPNLYSARTAAIKGFSQLASNTNFLLDKKLNLKLERLLKFIKQNPYEKFIIFGFTSIIWTYLIKKIFSDNIKIPKNNGIMIHGGGWKKLIDQKIRKKTFNKKILKLLGVKSIHNYYGMVEQTGSVFLECEYGYFHTSIFSDILIRNSNLDICAIKKEGLVQVLSLLPLSYPGHNILTEDLGKIEGIDNCKCGRKGKYFSIKGRIKGTEMRGCSDAE